MTPLFVTMTTHSQLFALVWRIHWLTNVALIPIDVQWGDANRDLPPSPVPVKPSAVAATLRYREPERDPNYYNTDIVDDDRGRSRQDSGVFFRRKSKETGRRSTSRTFGRRSTEADEYDSEGAYNSGNRPSGGALSSFFSKRPDPNRRLASKSRERQGGRSRETTLDSRAPPLPPKDSGDYAAQYATPPDSVGRKSMNVVRNEDTIDVDEDHAIEEPRQPTGFASFWDRRSAENRGNRGRSRQVQMSCFSR